MINCRARSYGADVVWRGQPGSPGSGLDIGALSRRAGASPYPRRGILRQPARYLNAYGVNPGLSFLAPSGRRTGAKDLQASSLSPS